MLYSSAEADAELPLDVTRATDLSVCQFDALDVDPETGTPQVNAVNCSACGLCLSRCPVGAIAWQPDGTVSVEVQAPPEFYSADDAPGAPSHHQARLEGRDVLVIPIPPDEIWQLTRELFDRRTSELDAYELRLTVRNLLRGLGALAQAGVRGDTSDRAEITFAYDDVVVLTEVEGRADLLEAVRRLMAGVAIAHARRGLARNKLRAAAFVLQMPNQRTDGYELIRDLSKVVDLHVALLPVAALHAAVIVHRTSSIKTLLDAGTRVDDDPNALDLTQPIARALQIPESALTGSAFRPIK